jgi:hypothetical protein
MVKRLLLTASLLASFSGCGDDDPPGNPDDVSLDPANAAGFQFDTGHYEVAAGVEVQDCYFVEMPDLNGDGSDVWIEKIRIGVNGGSHHTNIFRVRTIVNLDGAPGDVVHDGECFKAPNWADWPLVANNQDSSAASTTVAGDYYTWELPADVGFNFTPGEKLMVQVHYVNAGTQETPYGARAVVDMYPAAATPPMEMGSMFATQQSIRVCQSTPEPIYSGTCKFPTGTQVSIAATNGHFHSRGTQFETFVWDGVSDTQPPASDRFYVSNTWDDPPMSVYDPGQWNVADGGGIWWNCHYQWVEPSVGCDVVNERDPQMANDCCYTFGPLVEASEHCNVFLYHYPAVDRSSVICN